MVILLWLWYGRFSLGGFVPKMSPSPEKVMQTFLEFTSIYLFLREFCELPKGWALVFSVIAILLLKKWEKKNTQKTKKKRKRGKRRYR